MSPFAFSFGSSLMARAMVSTNQFATMIATVQLSPIRCQDPPAEFPCVRKALVFIAITDLDKHAYGGGLDGGRHRRESRW